MAKTFPTLYHKGKSGAVYSWDVHSICDTITTVYGQKDGLKVTTNKKVEQKNVGKANETSLEAQADKEALAMWKFKLERKYSETLSGASVPLEELPMLAKDYDKVKKKVFPYDIQPKLDGVRCTAKWEDGKIILTSRSGKPWVAVPHINAALEKIMPKDTVLDGELYIHGVSFQAITRLVRKKKPESIKIEYHVYDIPEHKGEGDLPWSERKEHLFDLIPGAHKHIKHVSSVICYNDKEVKAEHDRLVLLGYEGAIARSQNGIYLYAYRSNDFLKIKSFDDAEFEVTGWETGTGRYENSVIWVCRTKNGTEFKANHKISIEGKEAFLRNAKDYVGKQLTVRYFGLSEPPNETPRFPVGIKFRCEEDLEK